MVNFFVFVIKVDLFFLFEIDCMYRIGYFCCVFINVCVFCCLFCWYINFERLCLDISIIGINFSYNVNDVSSFGV